MQSLHYFLTCGYEFCHDGDEWIGIYDDISILKKKYEETREAIKQGKIGGNAIISSFDENTGKWNYDINPNELGL